MKLASGNALKAGVIRSGAIVHRPRRHTGEQYEEYDPYCPHIKFERVKRGGSVGGFQDFRGRVQLFPAIARP